jgi:hypothetical protein
MFISLAGVIGLRDLDYTPIDLLVTDLSKNDYFYDNFVPYVDSWAQQLFWLQSEEHIRNMGCLEWELNVTFEYRYVGDRPTNYPNSMPTVVGLPSDDPISIIDDPVLVEVNVKRYELVSGN